jgi:hypothetical protein
MNPFHHAESSARRYGGAAEDYLALHQWFDESKAFFPDVRHRALRHHAEGIFLAEKIFGPVLRTSTGRDVPSRFVGEQHVKEDLGWIPTVQDWLSCMSVQPWMLRVGARPPVMPLPPTGDHPVLSPIGSTDPASCFECRRVH